MARGSRLLVNRAAMSRLELGIADGLAEVGRTILEVADPPDAAPFGTGLVTSGGFLVYAGAKKVDGFHQGGGQPKKPRAARVKGADGVVTLFVGWGFPGRFQELGTVNHGPQPFATPALNQVAPHIPDIVREHIRERMGT
jgi:hypothetical protein